MSALLLVEALSCRFGGLVAVDGLSLELHGGEILGLIGPNGSGKTTVMNLISGALRPHSGRVWLGGRSIGGLPAHAIARLGVARTFQLVRVLGSMSCLQNVQAALAFGARPLWGREAESSAHRLLERVGLGAFSQVRAGELTYIDQKRLELARALGLAPRLLLLDEWLAGLNPTELQQGMGLLASLRDEGMAMLMVEHVMHAIRGLCSRVVVMSAGARIAEGLPEQVLAQPEVVIAYLGQEHA
ncbi:ABC transporter ATP-binding protein [Comamonas composti]|uniref:ABC transporter ATP-binding protein n=1 Tax=Comamonas composti TaxID=408558 RepID=UPI0003FB313E|nr:ABC transporter ATP-binding protein [Comamonas composti]